ncbi:hypothetical protein ACFY0F_26800 [Streptomyces sp. NPDC001544]|uniref:hypothetical protein n=1 Tax=Streptomyces sp. NPDC001544 TaxID=3364584 RepID=UPI0036A8A903
MRALNRLGAIAAAVGLTATLGVGAASTAHATTSCGVIDIGLPGNLRMYGEYAGQVEQQYNTCTGRAWAHWQWADQFQRDHSGMQVAVGIYGWDSYPRWAWGDTGSKNIYSPSVDIHEVNPDTWQAQVNGTCDAWGSWHAYADGRNWGESPGNC